MRCWSSSALLSVGTGCGAVGHSCQSSHSNARIARNEMPHFSDKVIREDRKKTQRHALDRKESRASVEGVHETHASPRMIFTRQKARTACIRQQTLAAPPAVTTGAVDSPGAPPQSASFSRSCSGVSLEIQSKAPLRLFVAPSGRHFGSSVADANKLARKNAPLFASHGRGDPRGLLRRRLRRVRASWRRSTVLDQHPRKALNASVDPPRHRAFARRVLRHRALRKTNCGNLPEHDPEKLQTFRTRSCDRTKRNRARSIQPKWIAL